MKKGSKHSPEVIKRISEKKLGSIPWNRGGHHTKEANEKNRLAHLGVKANENQLKALKLGHGWNKGTKGLTKANRTSFQKGVSASPKTQFKKGEARLKVIGEKHHSWKGGKPKCDTCGEQVKNRNSKKCWGCFLPTRIGENAPAWKGGITPLVRAIRTCFKYRQWRSDVFTRDDFTCVLCGISDHNVEADHIQKFVDIIRENSIRTLGQANSCEELWNINNGRTLCVGCHRKTDTYGTKRLKT